MSKARMSTTLLHWPDHAQVANILKTPQGIAHFLSGGIPFNIRLSSLNPAAVNTASHGVVGEIDFAISTLSDWETEEDIPMGYEELVDISQQPRMMTRVILIENTGSVPFRLVSFFEHPLPAPEDKSKPSFSLMDCVIDHFNGPMIPPSMITQLKLCCTVPGTFDGFLGNRYLCFCFENAKVIAPTSISRLNFFAGMRVKGCVQKNNEKPKDLSSEAKSFVPHSNMVLFDQPIGMVMTGHLMPICPPNYFKLLLIAREEYPIPPRMVCPPTPTPTDTLPPSDTLPFLYTHSYAVILLHSFLHISSCAVLPFFSCSETMQLSNHTHSLFPLFSTTSRPFILPLVF